VNLKRKYEEGSDYMDGIATPTVIQSIPINMRGPTGPKQSRKTQTILPTYQDERCHFGFNAICRSADGALLLSKNGSEREHINHSQDLNLLTRSTNMDDATRKLIQSCSRVSAIHSTAMKLDHPTTGKK
jgi:hypothetical protein